MTSTTTTTAAMLSGFVSAAGIVPVAALLGAGTGLGLLLIVRGAVGVDPNTRPARPTSPEPRGRRHRDGRRIGLCLAVGVLVGLVTRWPVAAILGACAMWGLPSLIGPDRVHTRRLARIEAIATWTESLRDTLSAAAGLEQAITATAVMAPEPINDEVGRLAARLQRGDRLPYALRVFATELDDATADLVVTALVMAAERNARHIGDLLTSLSDAAREQASLRMRIAAERARIRTSTRVITAVTVAMAGGLALLNRHYLAPYDTVTGQLVLVAVGVVFAASFWWLTKIANVAEPRRVLANPDIHRYPPGRPDYEPQPSHGSEASS
jgi:Flp pilus assembly protein TadB